MTRKKMSVIIDYNYYNYTGVGILFLYVRFFSFMNNIICMCVFVLQLGQYQYKRFILQQTSRRTAFQTNRWRIENLRSGRDRFRHLQVYELQRVVYV